VALVPDGVVTQSQYLAAVAKFGGEHYSTWLRIGSGPREELVDHQLVPYGLPATDGVDWNRPLVLKRAEGSMGLLVVGGLWLVGVEAEEQLAGSGTRYQLTLLVRRGHGPGLDPLPLPKERAPVARERVRWLSVEAFADLQERRPEARQGWLEGFPWLLVEATQAPVLPMLNVPVESQHLESEWLELYARLVLGEE